VTGGRRSLKLRPHRPVPTPPPAQLRIAIASIVVALPRGYDSRFHETLIRAGATYHLPLLYPDLAIGNWLYVRRVQGNVFGDVGRGEARNGTQRRDYRSAGGELTVDLAPLGLRTTVRAGVRMSRILTSGGGTVWQAVVGLN
jgi:hypothetical protein